MRALSALTCALFSTFSTLGILSSTAAATDLSPEALIASAVQYEHGEGVPRDLQRAAELYCRAARLGSGDAHYALGWMFANGRGLDRDEGVAWRLFALAAGQDHVQARHLLTLLAPQPDAALPACLAPELPLHVDLPAPPWEAPRYPDASAPVQHLVDRLAPLYDIDPQLAMAIIAVESNFRADAVSPKNAQGLMQLIPATALRFRVGNALDPESNIRGGLAYLRWLLNRFNDDVELVAAAYNAGEGAVQRHGGVPPYRETQAYVQRVVGLYPHSVHCGATCIR